MGYTTWNMETIMKHPSIIQKLIVFILLSTLITIGLSNSLNTYQQLQKYLSQVHISNDQIVHSMASNLEIDLATTEKTIEFIDITVKGRMSQASVDMNQEEIFYITYLSEILQSKTSLNNNIYIYFDPEIDGDAHDIWLSVDSTNHITRHDEIPLKRYEEKDNMDWFYLPKASKTANWIPPYINRYDQFISSFVTPLMVDDEFVGIAGVYLNLDPFIENLKATSYYNNDFFWLYNNSDEVIHYPNVKNGTPIDTFSSDATKSQSKHQQTKLFDCTYYTYEEQLSNGWTLIYAVPLDIVRDDIISIIINMLIVIILFIGFTYIMAIIFIGKYNRQFQHIIDVLSAIKSGDRKARIQIDSNDEIGIIADAINQSNASILKQRAMELETINQDLEKEIIARQTIQEALEFSMAMANEANGAKSDFLANMSHEIRTPINAIIGFNYLLEETDLTNKQASYLEKSIHSSKHLLNIIENILDISKIEANELSIEKSEMNLFNCINEVYNDVMLKATAKGLTVNIKVQNKVPEYIVCDEGRLYQIMLNLTNNAIKFTNSGSVTILISISPTAPLKTLEIKVTDTGIGIHSSHLDQLFQPFYQADIKATKQYEGTGLGLSICKKIVTLLDGTIEVESTIEKGSTFIVKIPVKPTYKKHTSFNHLKVALCGNTIKDSLLHKQLDRFNCSVKHFYLLNDVKQNYYDLFIYSANTPPDTELLNNITKHINAKAYLYYDTKRSVELESNIKSSDFTCYLNEPLCSDLLKDILEHKCNEIKKRPRLGIRPNHKKDVLVVEDNDLNQLIAKELIEQLGYKVTIAHDGIEALKALETNQYDLIFMDIHMPNMDGYETTIKIRSDLGLENLPIIAMTADAFTQVEEKALAAGMNETITKPIDIKALQKALADYLPD